MIFEKADESSQSLVRLELKIQIQQTLLHKTLVVCYGFESVQVDPHDIAWIIHFDTGQVFKYPIEVG